MFKNFLIHKSKANKSLVIGNSMSTQNTELTLIRGTPTRQGISYWPMAVIISHTQTRKNHQDRQRDTDTETHTHNC